MNQANDLAAYTSPLGVVVSFMPIIIMLLVIVLSIGLTVKHRRQNERDAAELANERFSSYPDPPQSITDACMHSTYVPKQSTTGEILYVRCPQCETFVESTNNYCTICGGELHTREV